MLHKCPNYRGESLNLAKPKLEPFTSLLVDSIHSHKVFVFFFGSVCMCHCLHSLGITKPPLTLNATASTFFLFFSECFNHFCNLSDLLRDEIFPPSHQSLRGETWQFSQENPGEPCSSFRVQGARDHKAFVYVVVLGKLDKLAHLVAYPP